MQSAIREALARGDLRDDDLVRPAGTTVAWARLAELSEVLDSTPTPSDQPASPPTPFPTHAAQPTSTPTTDLPGDFEIQAADSAESPVPSIESPLPIQERFTLRPDSDVTFPVINDIPAEVKFLPGGSSKPVLPGSGGWVWAEPDDEADEEEEDKDFDGNRESVEDLAADELEILDDEIDVGADISVGVVKHATEEHRSSRPEKESHSSRVALPVVSSRGWDDTGSR